MAQPKRVHLPTPPGVLAGFDGVDFYPVKVDSEGVMSVHTTMDFIADIEITGTPTLNRGFTPGSNGDNILVAVDTTDRLKLYKAIISPAADVAGEVYLKVGATKVGTVQNPKAGGQYVLVSCFPDYEHGALGEDLILFLPNGAGAVSVCASYEVYEE